MKKIFVVSSINMDLTINSPRMPKEGETVEGDSFFISPGGKGGNQAVAASKAGCDTYLITALGNTFKDELLNSLKDNNVHTDYIDTVDNLSSGIAIIVLNDKNNRIIVDKGSNNSITKFLIDKALSIAQSGDILICGYEINVDATEYALTLAKEKGMITILNPSPVLDRLDLFDKVDYLILNEVETEYYTGINPTNKKKEIKALNLLSQICKGNIIITLGGNGSSTMINNEYVHIESYSNRLEVVDTIAAGDTYLGYFASKIVEGASLVDSLKYASCASALAVSKRGAQKSIPTKKEVEEFIKKENI